MNRVEWCRGRRATRAFPEMRSEPQVLAQYSKRVCQQECKKCVRMTSSASSAGKVTLLWRSRITSTASRSGLKAVRLSTGPSGSVATPSASKHLSAAAGWRLHSDTHARVSLVCVGHCSARFRANCTILCRMTSESSRTDAVLEPAWWL